MVDFTEEQAARITRLLKQDIDWILAHRKLKLDPYQGCEFDTTDGLFVLNRDKCGTCLVGAHLMRHQPHTAEVVTSMGTSRRDFNVFAEDVRCDKGAAYALYIAATLDYNPGPFPRACLVATAVLQHAVDNGWDMASATAYHGLTNPRLQYQDKLNVYRRRCESALKYKLAKERVEAHV